MLAEPGICTVLYPMAGLPSLTLSNTQKCVQAFHNFCLKTARAKHGRLHQAGCKQQFLRIRLPEINSAAHAEQAQNMPCVLHYHSWIWTELCNNTVVPQMNRFCYTNSGHSPRRTRKGLCLGNCNGWLQWVVPWHKGWTTSLFFSLY